MTLLLDSGVWLAARDGRDSFHEAALALVRGDNAAALDLTLYEVANVSVTRWRSAPIARDLANAIRVACGPRLVHVDASLVDEAIAIADAEGLTVYDAAYVACARSRGWTLVSTDLRDLVRPGLATSPADALD